MDKTTISVSEGTMKSLVWLSEKTKKTIQQTVELAVAEYTKNHQVIEAQREIARSKPKARPETFADLNISVRSYNALSRGFSSIEDALACPVDPAGPHGVRNLGKTMAREIANAFYLKGYDVAGTVWEQYLW